MASLITHHPQKKLKRNSAGTFMKMGVSHCLLRGIQAMGYRLPTPIQRKCIPIILDGHDLIAMARTGSGKSAAFLIPLIENLKQHSIKIGCRALILSPTRDLALQTAKFTKSLSKYTDLRICVIIGGEAVEEQFNGLSYNPDIIIATPGRISYLLKEINTFNLTSVKYLIFDEADRLFEMGFAVQLKAIMNFISINKHPQTMLFSATMPKSILQFTRANLINPIVIRLDTDIKISPNLQLSYFYCRHDDKLAVLLYILETILLPQQHVHDKLIFNDNVHDKLILIFAATRYDVELICNFLLYNNYSCLSCYGSMNQFDRNLNLNKFRKKQVNILVVTDLASRGLDIPLLDYVINYQISTNVKSFIHRVGRVARNGKYGKAIQIIKHQELPYVADIYRYLRHTLPTIENHNNNIEIPFGTIPEHNLLPYIEGVISIFRKNFELNKMLEICIKSHDIYNRTKLKPSKQGIYDSKKINFKLIHPMFSDEMDKKEIKKYKMLDDISSFKPSTTVFEIGGAANPNYNLMQIIKKDGSNRTENNNKTNKNNNKTNKKSSLKIKKKKSYRDNEYFIENNKNDKNEMEFEDNGDNDKLKQFIMELDDDELDLIDKKKKLYLYNKSTRKYVTEHLGDRINRFMKEKNESSKDINENKRYGKLYREWQLKSKREISLIGSYEKEEKNNENDQSGGGVMGMRKYRHIKGSNKYYQNLRAKKRIKAFRGDNILKEKSKKEKIKKFKREKFRKWWTKNRERVKIRKGKRRMRGY